jgi:hypothetical protein
MKGFRSSPPSPSLGVNVAPRQPRVERAKVLTVSCPPADRQIDRSGERVNSGDDGPHRGAGQHNGADNLIDIVAKQQF